MGYLPVLCSTSWQGMTQFGGHAPIEHARPMIHPNHHGQARTPLEDWSGMRWAPEKSRADSLSCPEPKRNLKYKLVSIYSNQMYIFSTCSLLPVVGKTNSKNSLKDLQGWGSGGPASPRGDPWLSCWRDRARTSNSSGVHFRKLNTLLAFFKNHEA